MVYRGSQYPRLQGIYLYGDFCKGQIWGLKKRPTRWQKKLLLQTSFFISTFGEGKGGEIYVADYGTGHIYKVTDNNSSAHASPPEVIDP
jgi:hypothetical protein